MISRRTFNFSSIAAVLSPLAWLRTTKAAAVVVGGWLGIHRELLVDELLKDSYTRYGLKATDELRRELLDG